MNKLRVIIESIAASDSKSIKDMQKKINQWMTTDLLVKYDIHTAGNTVLFNICLRKEA